MINIDTPFWEHYFPGKRKFHKGHKRPSCQLASAKAWKKGMFLVKAPVHEMAVFLQSLVNVLFGGFWTSLSNICWRYPQYLGDVQWGHLPIPVLAEGSQSAMSLRLVEAAKGWRTAVVSSRFRDSRVILRGESLKFGSHPDSPTERDWSKEV